MHRPVFYGRHKGNSFSEERIEAFKRVLARHNIEFNEKTMLGYGDFWDAPTKKDDLGPYCVRKKNASGYNMRK